MSGKPKKGFRVGPTADPDRYFLGPAVASGAEGILYRGSITTVTGLEFSVAIKMLQPRFLARVNEWHARWSEQVELLRSLQVPGVVRVRDGFLGPLPHAPGDAGEGTTLYLVMNWVEGEALDEWVRRRPERDRFDALKLLLGVAAALDLMHSGGATGGIPVVHRDVKPSNIIVTDEGTVLVDFGLTRGLPEGQRLSGVTGTPGYLAPEASEAGVYTPATDRYAFGGVAYFVFTGVDPPSTHQPEKLRASLVCVPPLARRPEAVNHLMAMLDTDPAARPDALANWVAQLRRSSLTSLPEVLAPEAPTRNPERGSRPRKAGRRQRVRLRRPVLALVVAMSALLLALVGLVVSVDSDDEPGSVDTDSAAPKPGQMSSTTLDPDRPGAPSALRAPNEKIAFVRSTGPLDHAPKIYVMNEDGSGQTMIAETTQGGDLSWSPDGTRLAFADVGGIWIINADGTDERRVPGSDGGQSPAWSPDGTKLAFRALEGPEGGIYVINIDGASKRRLTEDPMDGTPAWSPDGARIAYSSSDDTGIDSSDDDIYIMNADGSSPRRLTSLEGFEDDPTWSPDGRQIAFRHNSTISVIDVDGGTGRQLATPGGRAAVNPDGRGANKLASVRGDPASPRWSPDGKKIAFALYESGEVCSIWVMNADGTEQSQLTDNRTCDQDPAWQPRFS